MTDRPEIVVVADVRAPREYLTRHGVAVWPPDDGHASRIRHEIGAAPEPPAAIGTVRGTGHVFDPNA